MCLSSNTNAMPQPPFPNVWACHLWREFHSWTKSLCSDIHSEPQATISLPRYLSCLLLKQRFFLVNSLLRWNSRCSRGICCCTSRRRRDSGPGGMSTSSQTTYVASRLSWPCGSHVIVMGWPDTRKNIIPAKHPRSCLDGSVSVSVSVSTSVSVSVSASASVIYIYT